MSWNPCLLDALARVFAETVVEQRLLEFQAAQEPDASRRVSSRQQQIHAIDPHAKDSRGRPDPVQVSAQEAAMRPNM